MRSTVDWHERIPLRAVTQETAVRKYQIGTRASDFLPFASDEQQKTTRNNCRQPVDTILPHRNPNRVLGIKSLKDNPGKVTKVSSKNNPPQKRIESRSCF